ncbi:MAG: type IV secretion system protein VirB10 [Steroidobacteraceae bacterium]
MTPRSTNEGPDGGDADVVADALVRGERGPLSVDRTHSLQSRASSIMACGLMIILGAGMLAWYYANALSRQTRARQQAQATLTNRVQGDMPLPPLGPVESSGPAASLDVRQPAAAPAPDSGSGVPASPPSVPLAQSYSSWAAAGGMPPSYGSLPAQYATPSPKTPGQIALERRLSGVAFARVSDSGVSPGSGLPSGAASVPDMGSLGSQPATGLQSAPLRSTSARPEGEVAPLLTSSAAAPVRAELLPTQRFLLAKGAFIDCTLETAIDSTLPGMTTCITATDTFGLDGKVVLLERGTKLIGETRGQVQQGAARVFVLWTEARTPSGIVVPLDSPAADQLGRSGLAGEVDRHFWDRFGAAILISTLDGAVQAAVQSASHGAGTVIYSPTTSESIVTDVLKSTVNIAPTVTKRNGERIQVFVARDLDFRQVYELRTAATARWR